MKMVIEPEEAKIVRLIYDEYLRTSSPKAVQRLLVEKGIRGREWVSKKGLRHGGRPLSLAVIRNILQNPNHIRISPSRRVRIFLFAGMGMLTEE